MLRYYEQEKQELADLVTLIRGELPKLVRKNIGALIVLDVHNVNTVEEMIKRETNCVNDFQWIRQLRYYMNDNDDIEVTVKVFI